MGLQFDWKTPVRFEDSAFPFGLGSGVSTSGDIKCDLCGKIHNKEYPDGGGEYIREFYFGDICVCECCFERLEKAVLHNIDYIIPWFRRILDEQEKRLNNRKMLLTIIGDKTRKFEGL